MSRLLKGSRRFLLGVAFVGVLTGTGGFMGAVGGLILVLVSQVVLGWSAGLIELMPASTGFGAVTALSFGVFLLARHTPVISWQPRFALRESKGEQASS
jgi:hypothetical protein